MIQVVYVNHPAPTCTITNYICKEVRTNNLPINAVCSHGILAGCAGLTVSSLRFRVCRADPVTDPAEFALALKGSAGSGFGNLRFFCVRF